MLSMMNGMCGIRHVALSGLGFGGYGFAIPLHGTLTDDAISG
jgi:hypothetical protein